LSSFNLFKGFEKFFVSEVLCSPRGAKGGFAD